LNEARIIWSRYTVDIEQALTSVDDGYNRILQTLTTEIIGLNSCWQWMKYCCVSGNRCTATSALELIEFDVIPSILRNSIKSNGSICIDWLINLAEYLETAEFDRFPDNSLFVASTIDRVIQRMLNEVCFIGNRLFN
jgi:hypothetical protein